MVALGVPCTSFPGRRTQSAFGHARLGLVLLYFDVGVRLITETEQIDVHLCPQPSLTKKVSGLGIGVSKEQY